MNRLRELREDKDLRLDDVANFFGMHSTTISKYELEQRALTSDLIVKFSKFYDVTSDYLLGLSNQPHPTVSNLDTEMLAAYHAAPAEIRAIIDTALAPYKQEAQDNSVAS